MNAAAEWSAAMVRLLLEQRAAGVVDFASAWRKAAAKGRAQGVVRPRDYYGGGRRDDPDWLPFSSFFRRACEREWYGQVRLDFANLRELLADRDEARSASHQLGPTRHADRSVLIA